ncbi:MAG: hypothetical protein ACK5RL_20255 [Acidimicrobiales bacterium]
MPEDGGHDLPGGVPHLRTPHPVGDHDGRGDETAGREDDCDPIVSSILTGLVVPDHRPGFWEGLESEAASDSVDGIVRLSDARSGGSLAWARSGRARWLAVAAAAIAVLGGAVVWRTAVLSRDTTAAYAGHGATGADVTSGASVNAETRPDYTAQWPVVSALRGGYLAGVAPDQERLLVVEPLAGDGGCENGPVFTVNTYRLDGTLATTGAIAAASGPTSPDGLAVVDYVPFRSGSGDNQAAVTFGCEAQDVLVTGSWSGGTDSRETSTVPPPGGPGAVPDGVDLQAEMVGVGSRPVWSPDGRTVTVSSDTGTDRAPYQFVYTPSTMASETRTRPGTAGVLLAELVGNASVYAVAGEPVVDVTDAAGAVTTVPVPTGLDDGQEVVAVGAALNGDFSRAAVYGTFGLTVVEADPGGGPPVMSEPLTGFGPITDADFAPNGDLLFVAEGAELPGSLGVLPADQTVGDAARLDIGVDPGVAGSLILEGARWVSDGNGIALSGWDEKGVPVVAVIVPEASAPEGPVPVVTEIGVWDESSPATEEPDEAVVAGDESDVIFPGEAFTDLGREMIVYVPEDGGAPFDVVDTFPAGEGVQNVLLGTIRYGDRPAVVWEHIEFELGNEPAGELSIVIQPLGTDGLDPAEAVTIDRRTITGIDGSWIYTDAVALVDGNLWLERAFNQGACYWIDVVDIDGNPVEGVDNPAPRPDVDLDELSAELYDGWSSGCVNVVPILHPPPTGG